jgi:hypothetical protein
MIINKGTKKMIWGEFGDGRQRGWWRYCGHNRI